MTMDRQRLLELFERYLDNQCSEKEIEILLQYFDQAEDNTVLKGLVMEALQTTVDSGFEDREDVKEVFRRTDHYLATVLANERDVRTRRLRSRYLRYISAAAIIIACSVGLHLYLKPTTPVVQTHVQPIDAEPGTNKAILTLGDGRQVVLDGSEDKILLENGDVTITKTADGQLVYTPHGSSGQSTAYNEIVTPRGGHYRIILPDGSRVWLNAESRLTYPSKFSKAKRVVELDGEAFFEIQRTQATGGATSVPFIVKTHHQEIEVLGTQFNIWAYEGEAVAKTTLVEGSVRVALAVHTAGDMPQTAVLEPGQQALSNGRNISLQEVDVEHETAWKNDEFVFVDMPLADIMKHLTRWYDVELDQMEVPHTRYTIFMSRQVKLSNVLRMLEETGNLRFTLNEENRIVITPKIEQPM